MGCSVEILNPNGKRTMFFIGGGSVTNNGIQVLPLSEHPDYQDFISQSETAGWTIVSISGEDYPDYYEMVISLHAKEYAKQGSKPVLVAHSAGGMVGLLYAKDMPSDTSFDSITLFNVPLIYPFTNNLAFQRVYLDTELITANVTLIMSKNDGLMDSSTWHLDSFTMADAIATVQNAGKVKVQVLDIPGYKHSPFLVDVAWSILSA